MRTVHTGQKCTRVSGEAFSLTMTGRLNQSANGPKRWPKRYRRLCRRSQPVSQSSWPSNCLASSKHARNPLQLTLPPPLNPLGLPPIQLTPHECPGALKQRSDTMGEATKLSLDTNSKSINDKNQQKLHGWPIACSLPHTHTHTHARTHTAQLGQMASRQWRCRFMKLLLSVYF